MFTITPDFSDFVQSIEPGVFVCKIVSCELLGQEGMRSLLWTLETDPEKYPVYYRTMIEGPDAGKLKQFLKCALDPSYEEGPFSPYDLIGRVVILHLEVEGNIYLVKEVERVPGLNQSQDLSI